MEKSHRSFVKERDANFQVSQQKYVIPAALHKPKGSIFYSYCSVAW